MQRHDKDSVRKPEVSHIERMSGYIGILAAGEANSGAHSVHDICLTPASVDAPTSHPLWRHLCALNRAVCMVGHL